MAQSSSSWGWSGSGYSEKVFLDVSFSKNDIPNNRSLFKGKIWNNSSNSYGDTGAISWTLKDQWATRRSSSTSNKPTTSYNQVVNYDDFEFYIGHNADGTLQDVNFTLTITRALGNVRSATVNVTVSKIPTIPRASSFTLGGSSQTGSAISVSIDRASTSFKHAVSWRMGSGSWTTLAGLVDTSASFVVPHTTLPNSTSGTITVAVQTYSGSTAIGSERSSTRSLTVPTSVIPSFTTITHSEYVSLVQTTIGEYVQHKSRLNLAITGASGSGGSTIESYKITVNNQVANVQSGVTQVITQSGLLNIVGTVTDSRGRSATDTVEINVLSYSVPNFSSYSITRSDASGTTDLYNTFATVKFKAGVSSLNSKNSATYKIESKPISGSWSTKTNTTSIGISDSKQHIYSGYALANDYQFRITISDKLHTTVIETDSLYLPTAGTNQFIGHGGIASAFGKIPTNGATYNLEIGDKGMINDGPYIDKNGNEIIGLGGTVVPID